MATSHPPLAAAGISDTPKRADNLALIFQETLTVIERLRANRQKVSDPEVFRSQIRNSLKTAETEALRRGYNVEDTRVGTFAIVAFLDESILNSQNPIFSTWRGKPLQEEMFGVHEAGEVFYRNLERLMGRSDSEPLADLLEVHELCLLLGFRGRYSVGGSSGEIRSLITKIEEKIRRIRGALVPLPWEPPADIVLPAPDRWTSLLKWIAIGCVCVTLALFAFYRISLSSQASQVASLAAGAAK